MASSTNIISTKLPLQAGINDTLFFGAYDQNIKLIEDFTKSSIVVRDNSIQVSGGDTTQAVKILSSLQDLLLNSPDITSSDILNYLNRTCNPDNQDLSRPDFGVVAYTHLGKAIRTKTLNQDRYIGNIKKYNMVFGIGPAGTGKTFLACAMAVLAYKTKQVERIILTRPAVEAGEKLGFLPGDMQDKVDPYLRPLYDAIYNMLGPDSVTRLKEKNVLEVVPLAYMRGRTLDNSFIILDEAQNTSIEQMKMFLTRMGNNSKMVITGDITQIDLPSGQKSGLKHAIKILDNVSGIAISRFDEYDVVRNPLVREIIKAYESNENGSKQ